MENRIKKGDSMVFTQTNTSSSSTLKTKSQTPVSMRSKEMKSLSASSFPIEILNTSSENSKYKNGSIENSKSSVCSVNSCQQKRLPMKLEELFEKDSNFDKPKPKLMNRKNQSFICPPTRKYQINEHGRRSSLNEQSSSLFSSNHFQEIIPENNRQSKAPEYKLGRNRSISDGPRLQIVTTQGILEQRESKNVPRIKSPLSARLDAKLLKVEQSGASESSTSSNSAIDLKVKPNSLHEEPRASPAEVAGKSLDGTNNENPSQSWFAKDLNVHDVDFVEIQIDEANKKK
ncbi:hypothetical protein HDV01_001971 [Terramyces sp. JEL0728]|nr:hypothetical protein HDV01_001971 [Terramyces sp. JEL0728]